MTRCSVPGRQLKRRRQLERAITSPPTKQGRVKTSNHFSVVSLNIRNSLVLYLFHPFKTQRRKEEPFYSVQRLRKSRLIYAYRLIFFLESVRSFATTSSLSLAPGEETLASERSSAALSDITGQLSKIMKVIHPNLCMTSSRHFLNVL